MTSHQPLIRRDHALDLLSLRPALHPLGREDLEVVSQPAPRVWAFASGLDSVVPAVAAVAGAFVVVGLSRWRFRRWPAQIVEDAFDCEPIERRRGRRTRLIERGLRSDRGTPGGATQAPVKALAIIPAAVARVRGSQFFVSSRWTSVA